MLLFAILLAAPVLFAQDGKPHPIDARMAACTESNPSTHGESRCFAAAEKEWDTELNRLWRELLSGSTAEEKSRLLAAQRAWIAFRDAEFQAIDTIYASREGTMFVPMRAHRRMDLVRGRTRELAAYVRLPR